MRRASRVVPATVALLAAACTGGGGTMPGGSGTAATARPSPGHTPSPNMLVTCPVRGDLLCGSIDVPLDRADPDAGTISIGFSVHPHTDGSTPVAEPIFALPGGPGSGGIDVMEFALEMDPILAHHDIVAISPRGTGQSAPIDCPDLQNGWHTAAELRAAVRSCGELLGGAADRYGSGDVALDVEMVRRALGYDRIDLYAFSYGSVPEQAYVVRFPEHVHALVLDAGMAVTDQAHAWAWDLGVPGALVREVALMCTRTDSCIADPEGAIRWLAHLAASHPVRGQVELPGGGPEDVLIDEPEVANLLQSTGTCTACGQIDPVELMGAISSLRRGNRQPLLRIADLHALTPPDRGPDPVDFSAGDNFAAFCNDQDFVWERTDPMSVRIAKFREAVAAFRPDAFAPFTVGGWMAFTQPDGCLGWPAPDRFEPAVPAGAELPGVPTLILAGDSDTVVPRELVETLHAEFPGAAFVTVAGAGHPVVGPAWGSCAAELVAQMFDSLEITDSSCAGARSPRSDDRVPASLGK
jgi:pimeloyl-ACP methyl ester carboxylesterase